MPSEQLIQLRSTAQGFIEKGLSKCPEQQPKITTFAQDNSTLTPIEGNDQFLLEDDFKSLLSTIVLFLNQDTYFNVPMNLDVNFCCVRQDNLTGTEGDGANIKDAMLEENKSSFQNSPLFLMFYEKINVEEQMLIDEVNEKEQKMTDQADEPVLSSMSDCQINKECQLDLPELAFERQLLLELQKTTALLVIKKQYELLLFILGQCYNSSKENRPLFSAVLKLFNKYETSSAENFKVMLQDLQFPYEYNEDKSLAQNSWDFKDFFSWLTNIKFAVVEGCHWVKAACCTLQGYELGAPIPLENNELEIPSTSTLFKQNYTRIYHCIQDTVDIKKSTLDALKKFSKDIAHDKDLFIWVHWLNFFYQVLDDMDNHSEFQRKLYNTQEEFFDEEIPNYNEKNNKYLPSNKLRKFLHEILTNAIFTYQPCCDLLHFSKKRKDIDATQKKWKQANMQWTALGIEPYQHVSTSFV